MLVIEYLKIVSQSHATSFTQFKSSTSDIDFPFTGAFSPASRPHIYLILHISRYEKRRPVFLSERRLLCLSLCTIVSPGTLPLKPSAGDNPLPSTFSGLFRLKKISCADFCHPSQHIQQAHCIFRRFFPPAPEVLSVPTPRLCFPQFLYR